MEVKRKVLLSCLDKVMPVISSRSLPDHQTLNFYGNRLFATNGNVSVDTVLPEGLNLSFRIQAEPFYLLMKKLTAKDVHLDVQENSLKVSAKKLEGEYAIQKGTEFKAPVVGEELKLENLKDFLNGLKFCRLGVFKDETAGPISGIRVSGRNLWACDRYRILNWELKSDVGLQCTIPAKLIDVLKGLQDSIEKISFNSQIAGGSLCIDLKEDTKIYAACIVGEYKDLGSFFPDINRAECLKLDKEFPVVLDRQITFLKDVASDDKEIIFKIKGNIAKVGCSKFVHGGQVERDLEEEVNIDPPSSKDLEFGLNPLLLKDIVGSSLEFRHFNEDGIVLFSAENFKYLIRARG